MTDETNMKRAAHRYVPIAFAASLLLPFAFGVLLTGMMRACIQIFDANMDTGRLIFLFALAAVVPAAFGSYTGKLAPAGQSFLSRYAPMAAPACLLFSSIPVTALYRENYMSLGGGVFAAMLAGVYSVFLVFFLARSRGKASTARRRGSLIISAALLTCAGGIYGAWH